MGNLDWNARTWADIVLHEMVIVRIGGCAMEVESGCVLEYGEFGALWKI